MAIDYQHLRTETWRATQNIQEQGAANALPIDLLMNNDVGDINRWAPVAVSDI